MKIRARLAFILVLAGLGLTGCSSNEVPGGSSPVVLSLGENVLYPDNEPPSIRLKKGDRTEVVSGADDYPSRPAISPNGTKMAYIAPYEFELAGDVWLYETGSGEKRKRIDRDAFGADRAAWKVVWADDERLLVLVGDRYGTVTLNREIFAYDLSSGQSQSILIAGVNQDIRELAVQDSRISFRIATYNVS